MDVAGLLALFALLGPPDLLALLSDPLSDPDPDPGHRPAGGVDVAVPSVLSGPGHGSASRSSGLPPPSCPRDGARPGLLPTETAARPRRCSSRPCRRATVRP